MTDLATDLKLRIEELEGAINRAFALAWHGDEMAACRELEPYVTEDMTGVDDDDADPLFDCYYCPQSNWEAGEDVEVDVIQWEDNVTLDHAIVTAKFYAMTRHEAIVIVDNASGRTPALVLPDQTVVMDYDKDKSE